MMAGSIKKFFFDSYFIILGTNLKMRECELKFLYNINCNPD